MSTLACSVAECPRPFVAKGYCRLHYDRWRKSGSTDDPYPEITERVCSDCGVLKPASNYSRKGRGKSGQQKYQSYCKPCENERRRRRPKTIDQVEREREYRRRWQSENRELLNARARERRAADPEHHQWQSYKNHLWKKYRLRWEDYEGIFERQDGRCAICGVDLAGNYRRPAVDHSHLDGQVRGLLCDPCNKGLGHFRDRLDLLEKAQQYIRETSTA